MAGGLHIIILDRANGHLPANGRWRLIQNEAGSGRPSTDCGTDLIEFPWFNQLADCRYGKMLFNRNDRYIGKSLSLYGEYSQAEIELFRGILDLGVSGGRSRRRIGTHTLFAALRSARRGRSWPSSRSQLFCRPSVPTSWQFDSGCRTCGAFERRWVPRTGRDAGSRDRR